MSYVKSEKHPGWIYDDTEDSYISPKGRLAPYPGAAFTGTLSEKHHHLVKERAKETVVEKRPFRTDKKIGEDTLAEQNVEVIKSLRFGDVVVNFVRVS